MNVITWETARSMKSGSSLAASQGMSREPSHCAADACSARSLEALARRHPLERGGEQHLQPAAELELSGLKPSRAHAPGDEPPIASASASYPLRSPGSQRLTPSSVIAWRMLGSS